MAAVAQRPFRTVHEPLPGFTAGAGRALSAPGCSGSGRSGRQQLCGPPGRRRRGGPRLGAETLGQGFEGAVLESLHGAGPPAGEGGDRVDRQVGHEAQRHDLALVGGEPAEGPGQFRIDGIGHNIDFLSALMQHPRFRSGAITTGFIAEEYPEGFHGAPASDALKRRLAVIAAAIDLQRAERAACISGQLAAHQPIPGERVVTIDGRRFEISADAGRLFLDGTQVAFDTDWRLGDMQLDAEVDGVALSVGSNTKLLKMDVCHLEGAATGVMADSVQNMVVDNTLYVAQDFLYAMGNLEDVRVLRHPPGDEVEAAGVLGKAAAAAVAAGVADVAVGVGVAVDRHARPGVAVALVLHQVGVHVDAIGAQHGHAAG